MDLGVGSLWKRISSIAMAIVVPSIGRGASPSAGPSTLNVKTEDPWMNNMCDWWDLTDEAATASTLCNNMAVFRYTTTHAAEGLLRASNCARATGESCVLSHEVGIHIPGVYIYDYTMKPSGMRFLVSPRLVDSKEIEYESRRVRVSSRANSQTRLVEMNHTIRVEYFDHTTRGLYQMVLTDNDAYCVQSLRLSVGAGCFEL